MSDGCVFIVAVLCSRILGFRGNEAARERCQAPDSVFLKTCRDVIALEGVAFDQCRPVSRKMTPYTVLSCAIKIQGQRWMIFKMAHVRMWRSPRFACRMPGSVLTGRRRRYQMRCIIGPLRRCLLVTWRWSSDLLRSGPCRRVAYLLLRSRSVNTKYSFVESAASYRSIALIVVFITSRGQVSDSLGEGTSRSFLLSID